MKNFIFKSEADFHKIVFNKLDVIQQEQRHQRSDLAFIIRYIKRTELDLNLQKQVDEYFEDDETSPQTEQKQNDNPDSRAV